MRTSVNRQLLITVAMLLTSCYVTKYEPMSTILEPYKGKSEHEVLLKLGPPTRTTTDGAGGQILDYQFTDYITINRLNTDPNSTIITTSRTVNRGYFIQFYINEKSIVYDYRTNSIGVPYKVKATPPGPNPLNIFKSQ